VTGTCEHSNEPSISTHKMPTIWLDKLLLTYKEEVCSTSLVRYVKSTL
jgi:hypothetical protein